jgi:hypothetical protein
MGLKRARLVRIGGFWNGRDTEGAEGREKGGDEETQKHKPVEEI